MVRDDYIGGGISPTASFVLDAKPPAVVRHPHAAPAVPQAVHVSEGVQVFRLTSFPDETGPMRTLGHSGSGFVFYVRG